MVKTKCEYPASHSIDTYWFAVDRDGRLANICSGEEGLLPIDIESDNEDGIIEDAMFLNSTEIEPGCRFFPLSDRHMKKLIENEKSEIVIYESDKTNLHKDVLILGDNTTYKELSIWKNRNIEDNPIIYIVSDSMKVIYVENLSYSEGSYEDDVNSGKILATSFFTEYYEGLCFSYDPKDEFENSILQRDPYVGYTFDKEISPIPPKFILPEEFHNIKKYDISFLEADEFDLCDFEDTHLKIFEDCDKETYYKYYRQCNKRK